MSVKTPKNRSWAGKSPSRHGKLSQNAQFLLFLGLCFCACAWVMAQLAHATPVTGPRFLNLKTSNNRPRRRCRRQRGSTCWVRLQIGTAREAGQLVVAKVLQRDGFFLILPLFRPPETAPTIPLHGTSVVMHLGYCWQDIGPNSTGHHLFADHCRRRKLSRD